MNLFVPYSWWVRCFFCCFFSDLKKKLYLASPALSCITQDLLIVECRIFSCSMRTLRCGMWNLVPWSGIEPRPPALGAWRLSHWTTMEVPKLGALISPSVLILSVSLLVALRKGDSETLSHLPKVTQYVSRRAGIWTLLLAPDLCLDPLLPTSRVFPTLLR